MERRDTQRPELLSTRLHGVLEPIEAATIEGESLRESLGRLEAWLIRRTLERADGRRAETARRPGTTREGGFSGRNLDASSPLEIGCCLASLTPTGVCK